MDEKSRTGGFDQRFPRWRKSAILDRRIEPRLPIPSLPAMPTADGLLTPRKGAT